MRGMQEPGREKLRKIKRKIQVTFFSGFLSIFFTSLKLLLLSIRSIHFCIGGRGEPASQELDHVQGQAGNQRDHGGFGDELGGQHEPAVKVAVEDD